MGPGTMNSEGCGGLHGHVHIAPDGTAWVNPTGTATLATGGSGDVLSGVLGALLAGSVPPVEAAVAAAFAHGLAGRRAAEDGPVTASDVADALRAAVSDLTRR